MSRRCPPTRLPPPPFPSFCEHQWRWCNGSLHTCSHSWCWATKPFILSQQDPGRCCVGTSGCQHTTTMWSKTKISELRRLSVILKMCDVKFLYLITIQPHRVRFILEGCLWVGRCVPGVKFIINSYSRNVTTPSVITKFLWWVIIPMFFYEPLLFYILPHTFLNVYGIERLLS